jgi:hypothetical protein
MGPNTTLDVQVTGAHSVPAGATAAVLNVTATNPTQQSFLTVWPTGAGRPTASNLDFGPGQTVPNLAEVGLGSGGQVSVFNPAGSVDVVVDLEGYTAPSSLGTGLYNALTPARITDTRPGSGFPNAGKTMGPNTTLNVHVTGAGGVPATGVGAAVLNVTATNPTRQSFLTVWPTAASRPTASNLNFVPGQTVPNRVMVPVGTGGQVSVFNPAGNVDMVVDVAGYFTDNSNAAATGAQFTPTTPVRITDTRPGSGFPNEGNTLGPNTTLPVQVSGVRRVPPDGVNAAVLNVTVTNPTEPSFLTAWPAGESQPTASDLNWVGGQTVANLAVVGLSNDGAVQIYNAVGSVDVVVDVSGWYSPAPPPLTVNPADTYRVAQENGPGSINQTDTNWDVFGADLGHMFIAPNGQIALTFGDTFGGPAAYPFFSVSHSDPRSNTMALINPSAGLPTGGLLFSSMISNPSTPSVAKELLAPQPGDATVIPTYGVSVGSYMFLHYMSVKQFGAPGHWTLNNSGMAYSTDGGQTWTEAPNATWPGNSNFGQVAMVTQSDGYVYLFGIPGGRYGALQLARVAADPATMLDITNYQYWNGAGWVTNQPGAAVDIVPAPVGELSVQWNSHYQEWLMTYLDDPTGQVLIRMSPSLTGPWSSSQVIVDSSQYPGLYAPYITPLWDDGPDVFFDMSVYDHYQVYLMHTSLTGASG